MEIGYYFYVCLKHIFMKKLTPVQQIQEVLDVIKESPKFQCTGNQISALLNIKQIDISERICDSICRKLHKEGFLEAEESKDFSKIDKNAMSYYLSFEGELLLKDGGYKIHDKFRVAVANKVELLETRQSRFAFWAAFGTVGVLVISLYNTGLHLVVWNLFLRLYHYYQY